MTISIDDILSPSERERKRLDSQIAVLDALIANLSAPAQSDGRPFALPHERQRDAAFGRQVARTRL